MPTKVGSIAGRGRTGAKFVELFLNTGEKVELAHELWEDVALTYLPDEVLHFVERRGRMFRFVHWVGTRAEAEKAVADGTLEQGEVPPPTPGEVEAPGWGVMADKAIFELFKAMRAGPGDQVGLWAGRVNSVAHRAPFPDLADLVVDMARAGDGDGMVEVVQRMLKWAGDRQGIASTSGDGGRRV